MANVDVIVHGVVDGQEFSKCDKQIQPFFDIFYGPHKPGTQNHVSYRKNNDVIYTYLVYENPSTSFLSYTGRSGSYFGISLVFHNQYVANQETLFALLQHTYNDYIKNKIISENEQGLRKWMYPTLNDSKDAIANYIANAFGQTLKKHPELAVKLQTLPTQQNQMER